MYLTLFSGGVSLAEPRMGGSARRRHDKYSMDWDWLQMNATIGDARFTYLHTADIIGVGCVSKGVVKGGMGQGWKMERR